MANLSDQRKQAEKGCRYGCSNARPRRQGGALCFGHLQAEPTRFHILIVPTLFILLALQPFIGIAVPPTRQVASAYPKAHLLSAPNLESVGTRWVLHVWQYNG